MRKKHLKTVRYNIKLGALLLLQMDVGEDSPDNPKITQRIACHKDVLMDMVSIAQ